MKKVLVFRNNVLPVSETFIRDQVRYLTGWAPILAGYRVVTGGLDLKGITTYVFPGLNSGKFQRWRLRCCQWFGIAHAGTTRALLNLDVDIVHAHFGTDAVDIWPSVRRLGLPMLVTLHGYDINIYRGWWEAGRGGLRRYVYPRRLLQMARNPKVRFIAVSEAIKQRAIEYGISAEKVSVSYVGVDTQRFKPGGLPLYQRNNKILFVGRMVENKSPVLLIKAAAAISDQVDNLELVMIGNGPLLDEAMKAASECLLPVQFLGARSTEDVIQNLHQVKLLCLPSIKIDSGASEGLGQVLLEAQACGVPVIGSNIGGIPEALVEGTTGLLLSTVTQKELEDCLLKYFSEFIGSAEAAIHASKAARDFAKTSFNVITCSRHMERIYEESSNGTGHV
ncbi:glycosyltransferase [Dyella sp.]|uniref:glycosyltransferase n=1 Tax=Dyella sp. TaxID=1869338 RepID=UPI002D7934EC|nr:glycosyltransferase [Dyella sp.]HET7332164.1 glycosyltransferase [Dyella sp.]